MNKHGGSRRWFSEADVKHLKSGALRKITNITSSMELKTITNITRSTVN